MARIRLTIAYNPPKDADAFFAHYRDVHVPLVKKMSGVDRYEWAKVVGTPAGDTPKYALLADLYFTDMDAFGAAMTTPEGQAAGADAAQFATEGVDMFISEVAD